MFEAPVAGELRRVCTASDPQVPANRTKPELLEEGDRRRVGKLTPATIVRTSSYSSAANNTLLSAVPYLFLPSFAAL